jgi:hypothetical protein
MKILSLYNFYVNGFTDPKKVNIYLVKQVPFLLELPEQALLGNLTDRKNYLKTSFMLLCFCANSRSKVFSIKKKHLENKEIRLENKHEEYK